MLRRTINRAVFQQPSLYGRRQFFTQHDIDQIARAMAQVDGRVGRHGHHGRRNPLVDIVENAKQFEIVAELPGYKRENVEIEITDENVLTLKGETKQDKKQPGDTTVTFHLSERKPGKFERKFQLPENLQLDQVNARMKDGLLTLSIPKQDKTKPTKRSIEIHEESS